MNRYANPLNRRKVRGAFTIIELLVVIAVIITLIGVLIPTMAAAKRNAMKVAAKAQLAALQSGLAQYYSVFHMYPSSSTPAYGGAIANGRGGAALAQGLVGFLPGNLDGAGAPILGDQGTNGFRMSANVAMGGTIYGPYGPLDKTFKTYKNSPGDSPNDQYYVDPWGNEILYFRSTQSVPNSGVIPTLLFGTANNAIFVSADCSQGPSAANPDPAATATATFYQLMGPQSNTPSSSAVGADSFLLISAGPDGVYFTGDDVIAGKE